MTISRDQYNHACLIAESIVDLWSRECKSCETICNDPNGRGVRYFPSKTCEILRAEGGAGVSIIYCPLPYRREKNNAISEVLGVVLHEWTHVFQKENSHKEYTNSLNKQKALLGKYEDTSSIPTKVWWNEYYSDPMEIQAHVIQALAEAKFGGATSFDKEKVMEGLGYSRPASRLKNEATLLSQWNDEFLKVATKMFGEAFK